MSPSAWTDFLMMNGSEASSWALATSGSTASLARSEPSALIASTWTMLSLALSILSSVGTPAVPPICAIDWATALLRAEVSVSLAARSTASESGCTVAGSLSVARTRTTAARVSAFFSSLRRSRSHGSNEVLALPEARRSSSTRALSWVRRALFSFPSQYSGLVESPLQPPSAAATARASIQRYVARIRQPPGVGLGGPGASSWSTRERSMLTSGVEYAVGTAMEPQAQASSTSRPGRRTYVVDRRFQLKYTLLLVGVGVLVSALFGIMMYLVHVSALRAYAEGR